MAIRSVENWLLITALGRGWRLAYTAGTTSGSLFNEARVLSHII